MPPGCRWASVRAFVEEKDPGSPRTPVVSRSRRPRPSGARRRPRTGGGGRWGEPALYARPRVLPRGGRDRGRPGSGAAPAARPGGKGERGAPPGPRPGQGGPGGADGGRQKRPRGRAARSRSPARCRSRRPPAAAGGSGRRSLCAPRGVCAARQLAKVSKASLDPA